MTKPSRKAPPRWARRLERPELQRTFAFAGGLLVFGVVELGSVPPGRHAVFTDDQVLAAHDLAGEIPVDDRHGHLLEVTQRVLDCLLPLLVQSRQVQLVDLRATQAEVRLRNGWRPRSRPCGRNEGQSFSWSTRGIQMEQHQVGGEPQRAVKVPINQVACVSFDAPTLPAEEVRINDVTRWRVWCRHCEAWHYHGPAEGHREAHCEDSSGPYWRSGYNLALGKDNTDEGEL